MSKYDALWQYIAQNRNDCVTLTFSEIAQIAGVPMDHAFLQYKKELPAFGYQVKKISMKAQTVQFTKLPEA